MAKAELKSYIRSLSGRCGDLVHYPAGNREFVRRYVIPANPNSEAQKAQRSLFAEAMAMWKLLPEAEKQVYRKRCVRLRLHGHNLFISEYMKSHKPGSDLNAQSIPCEYAEPLTCRSDVTDSPGEYSGASPYPLRYMWLISGLYPVLCGSIAAEGPLPGAG